MNTYLQDAIVLITSSDPEVGGFGTGFIVYQDQQTSYVVTCAHVVRDVDGRENIVVAHTPATVVELEEGIDVAILRVNGLSGRSVLSLEASGEKGKNFRTIGFQKIEKQFLLRSLAGVLGERVGLETRNHADRVEAWDVSIVDNYTLQPGYSGSPVVDEKSGNVIGIVSNAEVEGRRGVAISVEAVKKIWRAMPTSVFSVETNQRIHEAMMAPVQTPFLSSSQPDSPSGEDISSQRQLRTLTDEECQMLTDWLWACAAMRNPASRDLIVKGLREEIQGMMTRNMQLPKLDIRGIVDACNNYEGGIAQLMKKLKSFEDGSKPMRRVEEFLATILSENTS